MLETALATVGIGVLAAVIIIPSVKIALRLLPR